jgi:hypothetical protein
MEMMLTDIESKIFTIRGVQVMLDSDLAVLYFSETKIINRAVKRNPDRFPELFAFQVNEKEWEDLRFQNGTLNNKSGRGQHRKYLPTVFTEQGVAMLSAVLHTPIAIHISVKIIEAFISMRRTLGHLKGLIQRIEGVELKQLQTDSKLDIVLKALEKEIPKKQGIFFEGQLFDAHVFASDLIKQAKTSIVLVDNYVDETTLLMLSKRRQGVTCTIHTRIKPALQKDAEKHNQQYPPIQLVQNSSSHDRFLIIDGARLYHFGASLKDLGNKCFAFSRMDDLVADVKTKLLT